MYANFWEKFLLVAGMASFFSNKNLVSLMELTLVIANGQRSSSFKRNQNQYCQAKNTGFELCHFFLNMKNYKFKTYTVYQENQYFVKNMLLLKNPQFLPNHYEIL